MGNHLRRRNSKVILKICVGFNSYLKQLPSVQEVIDGLWNRQTVSKLKSCTGFLHFIQVHDKQHACVLFIKNFLINLSLPYISHFNSLFPAVARRGNGNSTLLFAVRWYHNSKNVTSYCYQC